MKLRDLSQPDQPDNAPGPALPSKQECDKHTSAVSAMFGRITPWYDALNHGFSLGLDLWWRRRLVQSVAPGPAGTVLDLAAGTLDVSLALCRRYPDMRIIAADICEPMLEYGMSRKVRPEEKHRISPLVADARCLPLPDKSVDAVTMAFGIRNVKPRSEALAEMRRVLVVGGRACVLEFAPVTVPVLGGLYHWYLKTVMPWLGGLFSGDREAYAYLADSVASFPEPDAFSQEFREAGFAFVQSVPLSLGVVNLHIAVRGEDTPLSH